MALLLTVGLFAACGKSETDTPDGSTPAASDNGVSTETVTVSEKF